VGTRHATLQGQEGSQAVMLRGLQPVPAHSNSTNKVTLGAQAARADA
jgi:hypothetical protein